MKSVEMGETIGTMIVMMAILSAEMAVILPVELSLVFTVILGLLMEILVGRGIPMCQFTTQTYVGKSVETDSISTGMSVTMATLSTEMAATSTVK